MMTAIRPTHERPRSADELAARVLAGAQPWARLLDSAALAAPSSMEGAARRHLIAAGVVRVRDIVDEH